MAGNLRLTEGPHGYSLWVPRGTSGSISLERAWLLQAAAVYQLFCEKQHDYGPENIAIAGEPGVVVRLNDKIQRLKNLLVGARLTPRVDGESVQDTWMDIADYGIIGMMLHGGHWPKPSPVTPDEPCPHCGK